MGTVTLTSGCSSFPHNLASRDVSFSSYVNGTDESFVLKLAESNIGSLQGIKKAEDGEIGVFGAEKYFSGGMDQGKPNIINNVNKSTTARRRSLNQNEQGSGFESFDPIKPKLIHPRTPSLISDSSFMRSESSWDSQSKLLTSVLGNPPPPNETKIITSRKSLLSSLRSKCSCSDKNSVQTDQHITKDKPSIPKEAGPELIHLSQIANRRSESRNKESVEPQREKYFVFPLANSGIPAIGKGDEEKPRKSLEIFGSPILEKGHKCLSLERRLTMLSWEATPRVEDPGISNDTESDASSDLFEIESLSSRVTPFLARQESDNMSGCITPTTCYAPSEASIEWSVVTGSIADYSVMSDCDELTRPPPSVPPSYKPVFINTSSLKTASKEAKRRPTSIILSGCKNDKSVRVAGDAHVTNDKAISEPRRDHRAAAFVPVPRTRFEAETRLTGFGSPSSFSRSHSPHASRLLYI